jgi:hypothetical protein
MAELTLKYQNKENTFQVIDEWNKLSLDQLLFIAMHWHKWKNIIISKGSTIIAQMQITLRLIIANKQEQRHISKTLLSASPEQLYDIAQLSSFVFQENSLTKNPLPVIRMGLRNYFGPNDRLSNISGFEFSFADTCYLRYNKSGSEKDLNNLIGILYRPGNGINRPLFNNKLVEQYAKPLSKLPFAHKQLILLWYIGCREYIVAKNKHLFTKENQGKAQSNGWISVIMELSGGTFGTFQQTGDTDLHLLFMHLTELDNKKPKKNAA